VCVIIAVGAGVRPSDETLTTSHEKNPHGIGVAWQENGKVRWAKGLALEDAIEINKELPFPYIIHYRTASHGTIQGPHGCHPFPVEPEASLALDGDAAMVLFHNGFWANWKDKITEIASRGPHKLPDGGWSDSRALAWMGAVVGPGFFHLVGEKLAILKATGEPELHGSWDVEDGIAYSNMQWKSRPFVGGYHTTAPASMGGRMKHEGTGGSSHPTGFSGCANAPSLVEGQEDHEAGVQAEDEGEFGKGVGTSCPVTDSHQCGCGAPARIYNGTVGRCAACWSKSYSTPPTPPFCTLCMLHRAEETLASTGERICTTCWMRRGCPPLKRTADGAALEQRKRDMKRGIVHMGRMA